MSDKPFRVAILDDYQNVALTLADWSRLRTADIRTFTDHESDPGALVKRLEPFDCLVLMRERTPFPRAVLDRLGNLRLLVTAGMRNHAIDLAAARDNGVVVSGTETQPYSTAELTWGLILALARQIPAENAALRAGRWQTTVGVGLHGKVLGVVGLGRQGKQVAAVGRAFGMDVVAWSQNLTAARAAEGGARLVSRRDLFALSDVVTIHLLLSDRTRGLIGADDLAVMKPSAFLVNTARGPIVEEAPLLAALERRAIAGAALDVFEPEPLDPAHPLCRLDNVILTPHLGYVVDENYRRIYGQSVEAIAAFLDGTPIRVLRD
jgi:phosphoglycerate dehydrogenase-like enzyme